MIVQIICPQSFFKAVIDKKSLPDRYHAGNSHLWTYTHTYTHDGEKKRQRKGKKKRGREREEENVES